MQTKPVKTTTERKGWSPDHRIPRTYAWNPDVGSKKLARNTEEAHLARKVMKSRFLDFV